MVISFDEWRVKEEYMMESCRNVGMVVMLSKEKSLYHTLKDLFASKKKKKRENRVLSMEAGPPWLFFGGTAFVYFFGYSFVLWANWLQYLLRSFDSKR